MIRIALVDGDQAIRAGRRLMIESQESLSLVYEESDALVAVQKIPDLLIDVLIIDHRLKGFDGVELASRLVDAFADKGELCPTIIITGSYATPELVLAAVRCGASDVVTQDAPMSELLTAINNASAPRAIADFSSFDEVLNHTGYVPRPDPLFILRRSQLSTDQKQILDLIDEGLSLTEARTRLGLGVAGYQLKLNQLLIDLHLGTYEQLYLALHDTKLT